TWSFATPRSAPSSVSRSASAARGSKSWTFFLRSRGWTISPRPSDSPTPLRPRGCGRIRPIPRQAPSKPRRAGLLQSLSSNAVRLSPVYLFELGAQKAQWLSARQTAIAANVANANTPGYRAVDIQPFSAVLDSSPIELATTNPADLTLPQSE